MQSCESEGRVADGPSLEGERLPLEVGDAGVELARAAVAGGLRAEAGLRGEGGGHLHEPEPAVVVVVRLSGVERLIRLRASACKDRLISPTSW